MLLTPSVESGENPVQGERKFRVGIRRTRPHGLQCVAELLFERAGGKMNGVGEPVEFDEAFDERTAEVEPDLFPWFIPVGMVFMMRAGMNQIDVSRLDFTGIPLNPEVPFSGDDVFEHGKVFTFAADAVAAVGVSDSGGSEDERVVEIRGGKNEDRFFCDGHK